MELVLPLLLSLSVRAWGQTCKIDANRVGNVRIGASKAEVRAQLSLRYVITEQEQQGATPVLTAHRRGADGNAKPLIEVSFHNNRAFLIDSYEDCSTREGIGPGATLAHAEKVYGQARIGSTDLGYFVWFDRKKGVCSCLTTKTPQRLYAESLMMC